MKIIGVGNENRGDDAIGILVARTLEERAGDKAQVSLQCTDGAALLEACRDEQHVVVIDCAYSGAPPGTIHHFKAHEKPLTCHLFANSTHAFGIAEAIELGRVLHELPSVLEVFAIEGSNFSEGTPVAPAVKDAGEEVMHRILASLRD